MNKTQYNKLNDKINLTRASLLWSMIFFTTIIIYNNNWQWQTIIPTVIAGIIMFFTTLSASRKQ